MGNLGTSGTTLVYNGVQIVNCETVSFTQRPERDPSGTDIIYWLHTIRVRGWVHLQDTTYHGITQGQANLADNQKAIRRRLLQEREDLTYSIGANTLLRAEPHPGGPGLTNTYDVHNGPKPQSCSIIKVVADKVLFLEFEIQAAVLDCESIGNETGVLNNRWSVADAIDTNFFTTRTLRGQLRLGTTKLNPHAFRHLVIPPLQRGYRRKSIEVNTDPSGLVLDYVVTDEQLWAMPPGKATKWQGVHAEQINQTLESYSYFQVSLEGDAETSKAELLQTAAQLAQGRTRFHQGIESAQLIDLRIVDHLHENRVELHLVVRRMKQSSLVSGVEGPIARLNETNFGLPPQTSEVPNYDRYVMRAPKAFGTTTPTGLFISYLQSPCSAQHAVPQTESTETTNESENSSDGVQVTTTEGPALDDAGTSDFDSDHVQSSYSHYELDLEHVETSPVLAMPIAKTNVSSEDSVKFVQFGGNVMKLVVKVTAERLGKAPKLPTPVKSFSKDGITYRRIGQMKVSLAAPELEPDGGKKYYSASAWLEYGMSRPITENDSFRQGSLPWDSTTGDSNRISYADLFSDAIV